MNEIKRFIREVEQITEDYDFMQEQVYSIAIDRFRKCSAPSEPLTKVHLKDKVFFNSIAFALGKPILREEWSEDYDKLSVRSGEIEYFVLDDAEEQEEVEEDEEEDDEYGSLYPSEKYERSDNDR